jgi:replication factor A1
MICVKVVHKNKKNWTNAKGSGTLMNIDLMDSSGTQIQATAFNQQAEKFMDVILEGNVYEISGGNVKLANKKFTTIPHSFSITFEDSTMVRQVHDFNQDSF